MSFTEDMDTAVKPPASLLKFDVDDVEKDGDSFFWQTDRMFRARYTEAALGPTDVDLKTLATHPLFRTALGELVFPFDNQCYELDVNATIEVVGNDLTVDITFQSAMDETVTPLTSEFTIYANNVGLVPDVVLWVNSTKLRVAGTYVGHAPDYDIALPAATDNLRCLHESVIPAFRLDTLPPP